MKRFIYAALLGAGFSLQLTAADAQPLRNSQIEIAYVEPANPAYMRFYNGLKARRVLEGLRAFLAPLKLPRTLLVKVDQCNEPVRLYQPGQAVVICYEYVARLNELAEKIPADGRTLRGVSRDDAVTGAFIQAVLQQTSTAVFDLLELPVWGREHDAADKLAGFLMMQFGTATARKLLNGAAYFFEASDKTWTGCDFSDVRGTESQRFYNYLCVAYGGDPKNFSDFVEGQVSRNSSQRTDILPQSRADRCRQEFSVLEWSFQSLIMPNVDPAVMRQVLDRDWLKPIADQ